MKKYYYVSYEEYRDYNQFEGTWELQFVKYDSFDGAEKFRNMLIGGKLRGAYRSVSPVLTEAKI